VSSEGKEQSIQVPGGTTEVIDGVVVVLTRIRKKHGRPEVIGFIPRAEDEVHVVYYGHFDQVVHILGEFRKLVKELSLFCIMLLL
jgi:flavoprotein